MGLTGFIKTLVSVAQPDPAQLFTPHAAQVISLARAHSSDLECRLADLAPGFLQIPGCALLVLRRFVDLKELQTVMSMECPVTLDELLILAVQEQNRLAHKYLGTEHLLLAISIHAKNPAAEFLSKNGLTTEVLREEILRELDPNNLHVPSS